VISSLQVFRPNCCLNLSFPCVLLAHPILLILITIIILGEESKLSSPSLCFSILLLLPLSSQNIILSTLFLNTLNIWSSLRMRDHVSHPNKTSVLYLHKSFSENYRGFRHNLAYSFQYFVSSPPRLRACLFFFLYKLGSKTIPVSYRAGTRVSFPGGKATRARS